MLLPVENPVQDALAFGNYDFVLTAGHATPGFVREGVDHGTEIFRIIFSRVVVVARRSHRQDRKGKMPLDVSSFGRRLQIGSQGLFHLGIVGDVGLWDGVGLVDDAAEAEGVDPHVGFCGAAIIDR